MSKKVLIVTYNYFPLVNPRALRWTLIAEKMVESGLDVFVICNKVAGESDREVINGVKIFRTGVRSQVAPRSKKVSNKVTKKSLVKKLLKFVYNYGFKFFMWPDSNFMWINKAAKVSIEIIQKESISKMISVSHPFSGHVVGYKIKRKINNIKWILDIGDPFAFLEFVKINNRLLFNRINFWFERKIVRLSDVQSVTTPLTTDVYLKNNYDCANTMKFIPPVITKTGLQRVETESGKNKWIFVGTLYKKIRSPKYLLSMFSQLISDDEEFVRNNELHFYGEYKMCEEDFIGFESLIGKSIFLHGLVRPEVVKEALLKSHILINIGNKTSYQLPSKLVEYMAIGSIILNIKSIDKDSSEEFLKNYPAKILINEKDELKISINRLKKRLKETKPLKVDEIEVQIQPYTADEVTRKYIDLLV